MGSTFVISGLRDKRARVAGELAAAQRLVDQKRSELAQVDAVLRMFSPDCDPDMIAPIQPAGRRDMFFHYKELTRLCLDILRRAEGPMRLDAIVDAVIGLKGFGPDNHLRKHVTDSVRASLVRMRERGRVRQVLEAPDVWWVLREGLEEID